MPEEAVATPPGGARPRVHSGRGRHCRWPGWPGLMGRYGLTRSMGAKGRSPGNAAAEGFFGCMRTESVHPGHWEERTRDRGARPGRGYIHRHDLRTSNNTKSSNTSAERLTPTQILARETLRRRQLPQLFLG